MKRKSTNESASGRRLFGIFPLAPKKATAEETAVSTPRYTVRVIRSCELHRSRSLLTLGNCSRYCIDSCRLAESDDAGEDRNG
jgi:hypothetical protein